jgi:molybdopterin synthase catalytic subunit
MMFVLTSESIKVGPIRDAVQRSEAGAVLVFEGITRNHHQGREVTRLEYEAYPGMAEAEMAKIAEQIRDRWPDVRVAMAHRIGVVPIGEASVVIATSGPHRDEAYSASRFAIDSLKKSVPIWKKEVYVDGSVWKANSEVADANRS